MPILLALDASSSACSAALLHRENGRDDRLISRFEFTPREHTRRLLPMVDAVLAEAGVVPAELDAVAYGHGPGSFTGLRIAAGVAQGLAFGLECPLIGVSTLEALALGAYRRHGFHHLFTVLDARMGELYAAAWQCGTDGKLLARMEESLLAPEHLQLPEGSESWVGVGSGWHLKEAMPAGTQAAVRHCLSDCEAAAEDMALLAADAFVAGGGRPAQEVQPVYLRDQVAWKKSQ
ncbi:tRNA (adenosine(37)-N6)-threonylcarbamoyltransferase complex dimerization subunit type 1 TsaB [Halomonas halocynthiae]|uniref:tRNA (adenosine(37)-N6)-threonylcarbamoyltransferase complex dimerization subunit type 1 TsaB n=1 Tax=Halomonas halocynthiae TaxID=176290 RepID=UPI0004217350|nr:tRNA (adenosine(37)-N6)-threonylcarbamoyltransferase complex dimerization subunit type 1 TsaB [Halomonas halocynthiae]